MAKHTISLPRLQQLIIDELEGLQETVDHKSINSVVSVASKLLAAVETFKEKAPPAAINALTPHLGELEKNLENMVSSPGSYVPVPKKEPKKVSLKAMKSEGAVHETAVPQIPDLRSNYIKAMADKKGLKIRNVPTGYNVVTPSGEPQTFKSRAELIEFLNNY